MPRLVLLLLLSVLPAGLALAEAVSGQGTWESTLQARDVDNDGTADAWYDTALDITWSANPNLGRSVSTDFADSRSGNAFGQRRAREWIDYLNSVRYLGVNRWRLPRFVDVGGDGCTRGVDCGQYHDVMLSEAAYMYAVTLGNLPNCGPPRGTCPQEGGGLTNSGPFTKLGWTKYWLQEDAQDSPRRGFFNIAIGHQRPCSADIRDGCGGKNMAWAVLDGDIADRIPLLPEREAEAGDYARLFCPGDIDLDGVADLAAVSSGGRVVTRSLDGAGASRFALTHAKGLIESQLIPDTDGNGAPELVVLGASVAEVRDLRTGELQSVVDFWSTTDSQDLEMLEDINGNGFPEIVRLTQSGYGRIQVRDSMTAEPLLSRGGDRPGLSRRASSPLSLLTAPTATTGEGPLLGVLFGRERFIAFEALPAAGQPRVAPFRRYIGADREPLQAVVLPDPDSDALAQVAVLKNRTATDVDSITLFSVVNANGVLESGAETIEIGLGRAFTAQQLLVAPDQNGNRAAELVVYEYETNGTRHKARINDGRTGESLGTVNFSEQLMGIDAAVCPDLNNNGSAEIAVLGMRPGDGGVRVLVKDSGTDELLGAVSFPPLNP